MLFTATAGGAEARLQEPPRQSPDAQAEDELIGLTEPTPVALLGFGAGLVWLLATGVRLARS